MVTPLGLHSDRQQAGSIAPEASLAAVDAATCGSSTLLMAHAAAQQAAFVEAAARAGQSHAQLAEACLSSARSVSKATAHAGYKAAPQQATPHPEGAADAMPPKQAPQRHATGPSRLPWPPATVAPRRERAASADVASNSASASAAAGGRDPPQQVIASLPPSPAALPPTGPVRGAGCLRTSPGGLSDSACSSRCEHLLQAPPSFLC